MESANLRTRLREIDQSRVSLPELSVCLQAVGHLVDLFEFFRTSGPEPQ